MNSASATCAMRNSRPLKTPSPATILSTSWACGDSPLPAIRTCVVLRSSPFRVTAGSAMPKVGALCALRTIRFSSLITFRSPPAGTTSKSVARFAGSGLIRFARKRCAANSPSIARTGPACPALRLPARPSPTSCSDCRDRRGAGWVTSPTTYARLSTPHSFRTTGR